ncbi:MAG: hypothetical protein J7621_30325 [Niastella sp.]|nr:hypothetical protein [Niastella sp.]
MKPSILKMRTVTAFAAITLSTGLLFTSCKKDKEDNEQISDEEVAEAITQSVSGSSGGVVVQTESVATMSAYTHLACGQSKDTTIAGQSQPGATITYHYSFNYARSLVCSPAKWQFNYTGHVDYDAPRMSSDDNSTAQTSVTGLEPATTEWTINSSYVRNGTQQSKIRLKRSWTSVISIESNVKVDKSTRRISSGTSTISFVGTGSGGYTVTRNATITYLGNRKATLTLKNGGTFNIEW